jgi:hypothetical protein
LIYNLLGCDGTCLKVSFLEVIMLKRKSVIETLKLNNFLC